MTTDSFEPDEDEQEDGDRQFQYVIRRLSAVRVEKGDALIFKTTRELTMPESDRFAKAISKAFPGTTVLVLEAGCEFHVVRGYGKEDAK